tara:strand:- start:244 stop:345 length:102 start_codon:yes stop_codon:yes gene_type:complete
LEQAQAEQTQGTQTVPLENTPDALVGQNKLGER